MKKDSAAAGAAAHPYRHPILVLAVRTAVAGKLAARDNLTRAEARAEAAALTDDLVEEAALEVTKDAPPKVGAGGILAFLLSFIQSPLFAALVTLLLSLFAPSPPAP